MGLRKKGVRETGREEGRARVRKAGKSDRERGERERYSGGRRREEEREKERGE